MGKNKRNSIPKDLDIEEYVEEMEKVENQVEEEVEEEVEETAEERKARFLERLKAEPKRHRSIATPEESERHVKRALFRKDNQNAEDARRDDLLKAMRKVEEQQEQEEK